MATSTFDFRDDAEEEIKGHFANRAASKGKSGCITIKRASFGFSPNMASHYFVYRGAGEAVYVEHEDAEYHNGWRVHTRRPSYFPKVRDGKWEIVR